MSDFRQQQFERFARAYPALKIRAGFKQAPEDFMVEEELSFEPCGQGEHAWLRVRKRDNNTDWVAARLADHAGVSRRAVGYAGLKDRFAVTTQWFSVHLPGRDDVDWSALRIDGVEVLAATRHRKKLQRGVLQLNRFSIRLRGVEPGGDDSFGQLLARCELIRRHGVPNYFGEQRFGHERRNLSDAETLFRQPRQRISRHKRGLLLSAARSWIFNTILSERVLAGTWDRGIAGDVFMLDGRSACFRDDGSADIGARIECAEIHPTAVLWGDGEGMATRACAAVESAAVDQFPLFRDGLIDARVARQRRALRLMVRDIEGRREGPDLLLTFSLQAGGYATMVLREIIELQENAPDSRAA